MAQASSWRDEAYAVEIAAVLQEVIEVARGPLPDGPSAAATLPLLTNCCLALSHCSLDPRFAAQMPPLLPALLQMLPPPRPPPEAAPAPAKGGKGGKGAAEATGDVEAPAYSEEERGLHMGAAQAIAHHLPLAVGQMCRDRWQVDARLFAEGAQTKAVAAHDLEHGLH